MLLLALLVGCNGDPAETDGDTDVEDTDPADTDVEDTDTDEVPADRIVIDVRADAAGQPRWKIAAVLAKLESNGSVTEQKELAVVDASSLPVAVTIDPPTGDDISQISDTTTGALLFWVLYDDADGSGARDGAEPILGTSNEVLAWIEDGAQFDRIWVGLSLDLIGDGSPDIFDAFEGFDVAVFGHRDALTIGGTGTTVTPDRLALLSVAEIDGETPLPSRPYDAAWAGDPWSLTVDAPLAPERWYESDLGVEIGLEVPVAATDVNGDGDYDPGETVLANACHDTLPAGLLFVPDALELTGALTLHAVGFDVGWNLVAITGDNEIPEPIPDADATSLVFGDCAL